MKVFVARFLWFLKKIVKQKTEEFSFLIHNTIQHTTAMNELKLFVYLEVNNFLLLFRFKPPVSHVYSSLLDETKFSVWLD